MRCYNYISLLSLALVGIGLLTIPVAAVGSVPLTLVLVIAATAFAAFVFLAFSFYRVKSALVSVVNAFRNMRSPSDGTQNKTDLANILEEIKKGCNKSLEKADSLEAENRDIRLQLQLLSKEKRNIEAIIYSIRDAVIVIDDFDRLVMANNTAEELFNFNAGESVLKPVAEVLNKAEFVELISRSRTSELPHVRHEVSFETNNGPKIFDCIISCVKDDNSQLTGLVAALHDITREKEISRMKNDFISHVSHEFKTPLASINAYAEMLVDGEAQDGETVKQFCETIQGQAQRLNRMIEDILNISRIESGLTKVSKDNISLGILVKEAEKTIGSYASEKNITLNMPPAIIHDRVYADKDMLLQVIINLLSNAVKYTPSDGTITVDMQVDESEQIARVTVADTGVGIPPDDVEHVFDKFYRVSANKKYAKGTGLGLNLVKQIVEKVHGGKVFVTSTPNKGSTFGFDIPLVVYESVEVG